MKNIFSGLKNAFKGVIANPWQTLLTGAAIYVGGGAIGLWDTPFTSASPATNALADSATAATPAAQAISGTPESDSSEAFKMLQPDQPYGVNQRGLIDAARTPMQDMVGDMDYSSQGSSPAFDALAKPKTMTDTVTSALTGVGDFIKKNPQAAIIGGNMLANAFSPNAIDVLRERQKLEREEDERKRALANQNTRVGSLQFRKPGIIAPRMA
jgi:hypothetical protein